MGLTEIEAANDNHLLHRHQKLELISIKKRSIYSFCEPETHIILWGKTSNV